MLTNLSREQQLIILGLVVLIITGLGVMTYRRVFASGSAEIIIEPPEAKLLDQTPPKQTVIVHISGAVAKPGVYKLEQGDRIINALELAGGATGLANLSSINLAEKVKDGQKIVVPAKEIAMENVSGNPVIRRSGNDSVNAKVNLNTAAEKGLCRVKGIGPSMAKKIIDYRNNNGPFSKIEDLMKVKGIGKGKFEKIKGQIII